MIVASCRWLWDRRVVCAFIALTLSYIVGLVLLTHVSRDVSRESRARDVAIRAESTARAAALKKETDARAMQIQGDRLRSCKRTYEGIREAFHPFLVGPGTKSPRSQRDIAIFNHQIDKLKAGCARQTGTEGVKP